MKIKVIDRQMLDRASESASLSPRKRANWNLHEKLDDPVQRLFNAIEPGTYIRPHRHGCPATWEVFLLVRGSAVLLLFDDSGRVTERFSLSEGGPVMGAEIPPRAWHTMASLEPGTVFFEVKQGPYVPPQPENIASWAPSEGDPRTADFESWFRRAAKGDGAPHKSS
jgi:cupin fold WbuC family metalloprotein